VVSKVKPNTARCGFNAGAFIEQKWCLTAKTHIETFVDSKSSIVLFYNIYQLILSILLSTYNMTYCVTLIDLFIQIVVGATVQSTYYKNLFFSLFAFYYVLDFLKLYICH